jgi:hypothetical protein
MAALTDWQWTGRFLAAVVANDGGETSFLLYFLCIVFLVGPAGILIYLSHNNTSRQYIDQEKRCAAQLRGFPVNWLP